MGYTTQGNNHSDHQAGFMSDHQTVSRKVLRLPSEHATDEGCIRDFSTFLAFLMRNVTVILIMTEN